MARRRRGHDPGQGFDAATSVEIGEGLVAQVIAHSDTELTFVVPEYAAASAQGLLVGLRVINGDRSTFVPSALAIVPDPSIEAIGRYDVGAGLLIEDDDQLRYNGGELVGIRGTGLSQLTQVRVNGRPAAGLSLVDSGTLVFEAPIETIGTLTVEVTNGTASDAVTSQELSVLFESDWSLSACGSWARSGDYVVTSHGSSLRLHAGFESSAPQLLSQIPLDSEPQAVSVTASRLAAVLSGSGDIVVYDVSNPYGPALLNRIPNPLQVPHENFRIRAESFVSSSGADLHVGALSGSGWLTVPLAQPIDDLVADDDVIYALTAGSVDIRPFDDPEAAPGVLPVAVLAPTAIGLSSDRLWVSGGSDVEIFQAVQGVLTSLGVVAISGAPEIALIGEVVAAPTVDGDHLRLYDLDLSQDGSTMTARPVSDVFATAVSSIEAADGRLRWKGAGCHSLRLPLAQPFAIDPIDEIGSPEEPVALRVSGAAQAWTSASLIVTETSTSRVLAGTTRFLGNALQFEPIGDAYVVDEAYRVELAQNPIAPIDGGQLDVDIPWSARTAPLFGVFPPRLVSVEPSTVLAGAPSTIALRGERLADVTEVAVNGVAQSTGAWSYDAPNERIMLDIAPATAGIYAVSISDGQTPSMVPAAFVAVGNLSLELMSAAHPGGADRLSTSGDTAVTLTGGGFDGVLSVHLIEDGAGSVPSAVNQVQLTDRGVGQLLFDSPPCIAGSQYRVTIRRPSTGDEVTSSQTLSCIDDVGPQLVSSSPLSATAPLVLRFDEAVVAGAFSVTETVYDYSEPAPQLDVTANFEIAVTQNEVTVRRRAGTTLQNNRHYTISIDGLADSQGNAAVPSAQFEQVYRTQDTLVPRDLGFTDSATGAAVTGDSVLVVGRPYALQPVASENAPAPSNPAVARLEFEVFLSRDAGVTFGAATRLEVGRSYPVIFYASDVAPVLRVRAIDASGNSAVQDIQVGLSGADIQVAALQTEPITAEENASVELIFEVTGDDLSLISAADIRVLSQLFEPTEVILAPDRRQYRLTYTNPTLDDIRPVTTGDQIPVSLVLSYGQAESLEVADVYTLVGDATAPEVVVVSPAQNARVPIGEPVEVRVQSNDASGIDSVTIAIGGAAPVALDDSYRFQWTPVALGPVQLLVEATDGRGNTASDTLELVVVEASATSARLAIHSPRDGDSFRERQSIDVGVELDDVLQATLSIELNADPNHPSNPAPIALARSETDPERFAVSVTLPAVDSTSLGGASSGGDRALRHGRRGRPPRQSRRRRPGFRGHAARSPATQHRPDRVGALGGGARSRGHAGLLVELERQCRRPDRNRPVEHVRNRPRSAAAFRVDRRHGAGRRCAASRPLRKREHDLFVGRQARLLGRLAGRGLPRTDRGRGDRRLCARAGRSGAESGPLRCSESVGGRLDAVLGPNVAGVLADRPARLAALQRRRAHRLRNAAGANPSDLLAGRRPTGRAVHSSSDPRRATWGHRFDRVHSIRPDRGCPFDRGRRPDPDCGA